MDTPASDPSDDFYLLTNTVCIPTQKNENILHRSDSKAAARIVSEVLMHGNCHYITLHNCVTFTKTLNPLLTP